MPNHVAKNQLKKIPQPEISLLIRKLRKEMELTQEEFASYFGVVFSTVNRWEKGHTRPSPIALNLIFSKLEDMGERGKELIRQHQNNSNS